MDALVNLAREKKIDELFLLERLEQSLSRSYKQILNTENDVNAMIDRTSGKIYIYELVPVGEPDEETGEYSEFEELDVTPDDVSRIAAIHVKKSLVEILHDHERHELFEEYADRVGELVSGQVLQTTADFTIIKLREGVEAELPHFDLKKFPNETNEKPSSEHYRHNQRLKAIIVDVKDSATLTVGIKGKNARPAIVISRTNPNLIRKLFEVEVPEIYEGIVEIKSVSREPGARTKIAVSSNEPNLDPVGACVGPKGSRVRMVVDELRNERVDVILFDEDPRKFVASALSPAEVASVEIDEESHSATVVVPDDQLSLAIGKEGQNARLAARLTGWRIDIKPASLLGNVLSNDNEDETLEAQAESDGMCEYVSPEGVRCRNHARPGSKYCGVHAAMEDE
jgi:N utilization substance protein A